MKIRYSYKNYVYSEKATRYSKSLGILTSWIMIVFYGFLFWMGMYAVVALISDNETVAMIVGAVLTIPFIFAIFKIKKAIERKIEKIALKDYQEFKKTVPESDMAEKFAKLF